MKRIQTFLKSFALLIVLLVAGSQSQAACTTVYTTIHGAICSGNTNGYYWPATGKYYTNPATYYDTLFQIGTTCDSILTLVLTTGGANPVDTARVTKCITGGGQQTYHYRDSTFRFGSGGGGGGPVTRYYYAHSNVGCDTIITVIINRQFSGNAQSDSINATICATGSYSFYGTTLTTAGVYRDTVRYVQGGCDSFYHILNLAIGTALRPATFVTSMCTGDSVTYHNKKYFTIGGPYYDTATATGCDTIYSIIINKAVIQRADTVTGYITCAGKGYTYGPNTYYYIPGGGGGGGPFRNYHRDTIPNAAGCDSVVIVHIIRADSLHTVTDSICPGASYIFHGKTFTPGGFGGNTFFDTVTAGTGCDTIYRLVLNYKTGTNQTINDSGCLNSVYHFRDSAWTIRFGGGGGGGNNHNYTAVGKGGACDTVYRIRLSVINAPIINLPNANGCIGKMYHYRDSAWTVVAGGGGGGFGNTHVYYAHAPSGCDTLIIVRINPVTCTPPNIRKVTGVTLKTDTVGTSYQWLFNGSPQNGANGSTYNATANGGYQVVVTYPDGHTDTSSVIFVTGVGIHDVPGSMSFALYPNPNSGTFTLEAVSMTGMEAVVYDLVGRVVYQRTMSADKETISMSNVNSGTYFIILKGKEVSTPVQFTVTK